MSSLLMCPSSADVTALLNNSIMAQFFKQSVVIVYLFDSLEAFHNHLSTTVLNFNLTNNNITDLICDYNAMFHQLNSWLSNNNFNMKDIQTDQEQNDFLQTVFPEDKVDDIKSRWMYLIANLILYLQINNNGEYGGEGYQILRESAYTIHHLIGERDTFLKICPICKCTISQDINPIVLCDCCTQQYCCQDHKEEDKWEIIYKKPHTTKKNHSCILKEKQCYLKNVVVDNDFRYTEDFPFKTRFAKDDPDPV